jgi:DnaJ like chaperone protein
MAIFGKIIGGAIGFAVGGPLGAVAGAAFGNSFDQEDHYSSGISVKCPHCSTSIIIEGIGYWKCSRCNNEFSYGNTDELISPEERFQYIFLITTFACLGKIAKADGVVSSHEVKIFEDFARNALSLNDEDMKYARDIFYEAGNSNESFDDIVKQFYDICKEDRNVILEMMFLQLRLAMADGKLDPREEGLLLKAKSIFKISDNEYKQMKALFIHDNDEIDHIDAYYTVLGCNKNDSDETIKTRHRELVHKFHPDKLSSKGLPEELIEFSNQKFKTIQTAYEAVKQDRILNAPPVEKFRRNKFLPCRLDDKYSINSLNEIIDLLRTESKLLGKIIRDEVKSDFYPWLEVHHVDLVRQFKETAKKYPNESSTNIMISELYNPLMRDRFKSDPLKICMVNEKISLSSIEEIIILLKNEPVLMGKVIKHEVISDLYPWLDVHNGDDLVNKFKEAVKKYSNECSSVKMVSEIYTSIMIEKFTINPDLPCRLTDQINLNSIDQLIDLLRSKPDLMGKIIREEVISDLFPWLGVHNITSANQFKVGASKYQANESTRMVNSIYLSLSYGKIKPFLDDDLEITNIEEIINIPEQYKSKILSLIKDQNSILSLWLQAKINSFDDQIKDIGIKSWDDFTGIISNNCVYDRNKWKTKEQKKFDDELEKEKYEKSVFISNRRANKIFKQKRSNELKRIFIILSSCVLLISLVMVFYGFNLGEAVVFGPPIILISIFGGFLYLGMYNDDDVEKKIGNFGAVLNHAWGISLLCFFIAPGIYIIYHCSYKQDFLLPVLFVFLYSFLYWIAVMYDFDWDPDNKLDENTISIEYIRKYNERSLNEKPAGTISKPERSKEFKEMATILLIVVAVCSILAIWGMNQNQANNQKENLKSKNAIIDTKKIQPDVQQPVSTIYEKGEVKDKVVVDDKNLTSNNEEKLVSKIETNKIFKIGDRGPAGGYIFYDKGSYSDGWRYLEAAPEDQHHGNWDNGSISTVNLVDKTYIATGANGSGIGFGKLNTLKISQKIEGQSAAKICINYRGGGKNDWFLPSKDELYMVFEKLFKSNISKFSPNLYWSSSEYDSDDAWYHNFSRNSQGKLVKGEQGYVRPIRAF